MGASVKRKAATQVHRAVPAKNRTGLFFVLGAVLLIGSLVAFASVQALGGDTTTSGTTVDILPAGLRDPAPDVTLTTSGGPYQIGAQKGKTVLLYFSFPG